MCAQNDVSSLRRPGSEIAALYVCSNEYLLGKVVATSTGWEFQALPGFPAKPGGTGGGGPLPPSFAFCLFRTRISRWHAHRVGTGP